MGYGKRIKCKNCGWGKNLFLDVGFSYPLFTAKVKEDAEAGKLGKTWQKTVRENPSGQFDMSARLYLCPCGGWRDDYDGSYYRLPAGEEKEHSFSCRGLELIRERKHFCPSCRGSMKPADPETLKTLKCPECGEDMDFSSVPNFFGIK